MLDARSVWSATEGNVGTLLVEIAEDGYEKLLYENGWLRDPVSSRRGTIATGDI